MDWKILTQSALKPDLLRLEVSSTLLAADEARVAGDRAESIRRIEEAYALSDRLALIMSGPGSGRLLDSEEASG
jgi:hypothetical protein